MTPSETGPADPMKGVGEHGDLPAPTGADREAAHGHADEGVDEASDESFPASDPPAFTHSHAGAPEHGKPDRSKTEDGR